MRVLSVRSKRLFFIVRLVVYCLKTIGLAPFSVQNEKPSEMNPYDSHIQAFFPSKFGLAYNTLFLFPVIILMHIFCPTTYYYRANLSESAIMNILFDIWTAKRVLLVFTSCLVIICWASGQKNAARIMNRLLEVDIGLSELKRQLFDKRALIFLAIHGVLNACLWIIYWIWLRDNSNQKLSVNFVSRIPEYVVYWFMIEYVTIVGLVFRDLQTVNKYLLDIKQFENYLSRLPVNCAVVSASTHSNGQIASLKLLRSVRTKLSELCDDIADFFSLPILFCMASSFVSIFEALYYTTQMTNDSPISFIAHCVGILVLQQIYPIVSLTLNVTQTKKEAELTGQIVHKLLAVAKTGEVKEEVEQFSHQLLHEKVNFTAYGFFTLDFTLLQSMLAGVAGYAILLTQFGSSVCNCNCNCNCKNISTVE